VYSVGVYDIINVCLQITREENISVARVEYDEGYYNRNVGKSKKNTYTYVFGRHKLLEVLRTAIYKGPSAIVFVTYCY
jgi:hypothetical protein